MTPVAPLNRSAQRLADIEASVNRRAIHRDRIERNPELIPIELSICRDDPAYWINNWGWTYDPRPEAGFPAHLPMDLWPKQDALLRWIRWLATERKPGAVCKSRDTGVSYICCFDACHELVFGPGLSVGFGSRTQDEVDKLGDPDSLLEKCRLIIEDLPEWMQPRGYERDKHAIHMQITNPVSGATIKGDVGKNIGRGGRKARYFVDESAFLENPEMVNRALSANTNTRIDVSTVNGIGNDFYRRVSEGLPKEQIFTIGWEDDPRKDEVWKIAKEKEIGTIDFAREYGRDFAASIEGLFIPSEWVMAAVDLDLPEGTGPIIASLDVAEEGANQNVLGSRRGPVVHEDIASWNANTTQTAHRALEECAKRGATILRYDGDGVGAGPRGTWASMELPYGLHIEAIHNGSPASDDVYMPGGKTAHETFANIKAQLWWFVRCRFEKTFEVANGRATHPLDEMISIPNDPKLIAQISTPKRVWNTAGKIAVESKDQLRARNIKSPDYADMLMNLFAVEQAFAFSGQSTDESPTASVPKGVVYDDAGRDLMKMRL